MGVESKLDHRPLVVLETSAAIAYLQQEPESRDVEELLRLTEAGLVDIALSEFAWAEIDSRRHSGTRLQRLDAAATVLLPKVARLGSWQLGRDVLGHEASGEIEEALPRGASRQDREQLLSYAARAEIGFLVTKDAGDFLGPTMTRMYVDLGFHVGLPAACVRWLRDLGIPS